MKLSKRDFFKMIGAGSAAAASYPTTDLNGKTTIVPATNAGIEAVERAVQSAYVEAVESVLYDRMPMPAGTELPAMFTFFATPFGQVCPVTKQNRSPIHTNLPFCGRLPAPGHFLIQEIHFIIQPDALMSDLKKIQ